MRVTIGILLVFVCLFSSCENKNYTYISEVNPFLGTSAIIDPEEIGYTPPENWRVWAGLVFPGAALPNAMVQLTPVTAFGSGAGYQYEDDRILGFSHTMKGHWNLGNIAVFPASRLPDPQNIGSYFSHSNEKASPGYYEVLLDDDSILVKLTTTPRCGFHHYAFHSSDNSTILFDLRKANNRVDNSEMWIENSIRIVGYQQTEEAKVYFCAEFEHPFDSAFVSAGQYWTTVRDFSDMDSENPLMALQFYGLKDDEIKMRVGLSFVSIANAKLNLKHEIDHWDFQKIKREAEQKWETLLSRIRVEGGSEKERMIFYTSFYRSFLWPALRSDVDGSYLDANGQIANSERKHYSLPSLWDTFRNKLVLLSILDKDLTADIIQSMIDRGNISGYMPIFFHGDHAASFITSAYSRGVDQFNVKDAYKLLLKNAYESDGPREHLQEYIEKGYIATETIDQPHVESGGKAGVAKTLEYAYNDYSLAQFAEAIEDTSMINPLLARSQNYRNVFDASSGFMRGRQLTGEWVSPFYPEYPYYEYMFREANAWQQTFFVPHDIDGLIKLFGGTQPFEEKLDTMFIKDWNPEYIARNICCFIGQYCHGNQPDHHVPYLYYFVDKPWKSQAIINQIQALYGIGNKDLALPGMDDTGEMSSWYVFTSMGIYPFSPADPEYLLSIPKFPRVDLIIDDTTTLSLIRETEGLNIIDSIVFKGIQLSELSFQHSDLAKGGEIRFYTE